MDYCNGNIGGQKWRDEQLKVLENCEHGFKDLAMENLNKIYKGMGGKI